MYETVRWILLFLLIASLLGTWIWAQQQGGKFPLRTILQKRPEPILVLHRRHLDQKTGVCLLEVGDETFLLAYTVGGSVAWQPVASSLAVSSPLSPLSSVTGP